MRPLRILISGVYSTIPLTLLLISAVLLSPKHIDAQCPAGAVPKTITYTTNLTASGGNVYSISFPQFNPSVPAPGGYTLLSAVLSATATTNLTINYQNTDPVNPQDFFPSIYRRDKVIVNGITAVPSTQNQFDYIETILAVKGAAGDNVTYGPGATFSNTTLFTTTITNPSTLTGTYQGAGNISGNYSSTFFVSTFIPSAVAVTASIADNITFTLTYNYCDPNVLASSILSFTATKVNSQTADLKWNTTNEQPGRKYYIEVSSNGQDFATTGSVPSNASNSDASYTYTYSIPSAATGKLYFRIRQVDAGGTVGWSDVRVINLDGSGSTFAIYPNPPTDFINLTIPGATQDWQVDIFAADGSLVQRSYYRNANAARVNFGRRMAASTYFVRATNPQTGKHYTGSFVVSK